jgi:Spy/CpxP family protein refolding chaperone
MRSTHSIHRVLTAWVCAALLGASAVAPVLAQRGGGGGGRGGGGAAFAPELTRLESLEAGFKLTKDQKKAVKALLDDDHRSAAPIREGLVKTRSAIAVAIQAGGAQSEIDAAVNAYASQAAAMAALEMKALAQIMEALDKEQRANEAGVRSAFFLMRGIFLDSKKWDEVPDSRSY